jgi:hypothetical protein
LKRSEEVGMKRALITGITGQDGSYLADFLLEKGYKSPSTNPSDFLLNDYFNFTGNLIEVIVAKITDLLSVRKTVEPSGYTGCSSIRERMKEIARLLYQILYLYKKPEYRLSANKIKGFDEASVRKVFHGLKVALFNTKVELERLKPRLFRISMATKV